MKQEMKIAAPAYKLAYAFCYALLLAVVRGVSKEYEIGISQTVNMALLAIVFCGDCWESEYLGRRWEVVSLAPGKRKIRAVRIRFAFQVGYLLLFSALGYVCYYWQRPQSGGTGSSVTLFALSMAAVFCSLAFFGALSMTLSNWMHSYLGGVGVSLVLWSVLGSRKMLELLGNWGVFAFSSRFVMTESGMVENGGWWKGSLLALALSAAALWAAGIFMRERRRSYGN